MFRTFFVGASCVGLGLVILSGCGSSKSQQGFSSFDAGASPNGNGTDGSSNAGLGTNGNSLVDASCGSASIPTEREPGALVLVLDRSSSMNDPPISGGGHGGQASGPSKWALTQPAMHSVLDSLPDSLLMGFVGFPGEGDDDCNVDTAPQVPVGPLSTTRSEIYGYIDAASASGGDTPTEGALSMTYSYLQTLGITGKLGVILVTDGDWNCATTVDLSALDTQIYNDVSGALKNGIETFAVGVPGADGPSLSMVAHLGGTDIVAGCDPTCQATQCCYYDTSATNFTSDLTTALDAIASKFLASCVFKLPKGSNPAQFDPSEVNVEVTGATGAPQTIPQDAAQGWTFVDSSDNDIELHGDICNTVLTTSATVGIVLGCPTIIN